jgi:coatomer subunit beta'
VVSGTGTNLVWHNDSDFAVLDNEVITVYRNFEKGDSVKLPVTPQRIFEGLLLGIADAEKTLLVDWQEPGTAIHRIEASAEKVWWDEEGELLALATETKLVLYQFNRKNRNLSELLTISDRITSGLFVDRIFYFINRAGKLHFSFLGKAFFFGNAEKKQFILGALEQQERLYLFDKNNAVYSHRIPFGLLKQVRLFIEGKVNEEPEVPAQFKDRVAKVYHGFELKKEAFKLTDNQDHKFELALQLSMIREGKGLVIKPIRSQ